MDNKQYVSLLAAFLATNGTVMAASELATHLNRNNLRTGYGAPYKGGRGTYTLIDATYDWLEANGKLMEAKNVAI